MLKQRKRMRLTPAQSQIIKDTVNRVLGTPSRVWLFGSRADDSRRGGDIDLLVETDVVLPNRAEAICRLYGALIMALGDRKLDIALKDARTMEAPIFEIARRTGVPL
jgi:predicted nucleotidyltransferase